MFQWLFKLKKGWYYLFLCVFTVIVAWLSNFYLSEILAFNILGEQYTQQEIIAIMQKLSSWKYLTYALLPAIIILRVLFTAFCLFVGSLFQEYHWQWKKLFNISLKADVVFALAAVLQFYYYLFVNQPQTIDDMNTNFVSLLALLGRENVPVWLATAYSTINLFEMLYVAVLVVFIHKIFSFKYWKSVLFVLLTYVVGNYFYVIALTFLYLNYL